MFINVVAFICGTLLCACLLGLLAYAVQYTLAVMTEKALNTTEHWVQTRQQEAERAQEPQHILLRAGTREDAQPQTLVRPAMATEEAAPETLLRPASAAQEEHGANKN